MRRRIPARCSKEIGPSRELRVRMTVKAYLALLVGVGMLARFDYGAGAAMQFEVSRSWIPSIGAGYHVGVDGIALPLLVLSLLLSLLCVVYSWRILPEPRNPKAFLALLLLLETGMNGTFVALDLVLFFVFWETVLIPMYFMIAVWGGARRDYASIKFILYTLIGSVIMLLGFLALWLRSSPDAAGRTFDMLALQEVGAARFGGTFGTIVFAAVALGFAVKVPVWPFHTWLPDAHTEAPTVGSVLLAGILLKMGTYGFVRIAIPILPEAAQSWAPWIGGLEDWRLAGAGSVGADLDLEQGADVGIRGGHGQQRLAAGRSHARRRPRVLDHDVSQPEVRRPGAQGEDASTLEQDPGHPPPTPIRSSRAGLPAVPVLFCPITLTSRRARRRSGTLHTSPAPGQAIREPAGSI